VAEIVSLLFGLVEITEGRMTHHLGQLALGDLYVVRLFCGLFQGGDGL
jgi:hypothetical protein